MDKLLETPELFFEVGARVFIQRMTEPKTEKIWRIISIELYHNEKIRELFKKELLEEPIKAWEAIFTKMIEKKVIKPYNPQILANEYFYFVIYLFFEYFVLKYEDDLDSFMDFAWEKMSNHAEFLLEVIKA